MYPGIHSRKTPDRPAVIMAETGETRSFAELEESSTRLARWLHDHGLRRGDNFALLSENSLEYYDAYWAAKRSGLYVTAINHNLSANEAAYIVNDCGAKVLICSANKRELADALVGMTPDLEYRLAIHGALSGHLDYSTQIAQASLDPVPDDREGGDMLYSSGTTGLPKAIKQPLPERRLGEPGDPYISVFGPMYGFDESTVYLCPAPLYHAAPFRFGGWVHALGGAVVVMQGFDAAAALAAIETYRVTHSQWVPTMFIRMLKSPDAVRRAHDLTSHRVAIHAAAPCPREVKQAMIEWWGPILHEYYASTEGMGITLIDSPTWLEHPGSVGRAALGVLRICDDRTGEELATGEIGTVYFERDTVPFTYHNDPEKTRAAQHPEHSNWTTSGDVGYVDTDGYLYLTDRKAFTIISGGVNIYPQEIEDVLALHPKVSDIAVIGVPDDDLGEQVKAVVQAAPDAEPGPTLADELSEFLRDRLARFKIPRSFDFVEDLPRTPTGKLQKGKLRERYVTGRLATG